MKNVSLTLAADEDRTELPAVLSLRGHLLCLRFRLPDAELSEQLLFTLDAAGQPLSLRRTSPAVSMHFLPGESCEGFLMTRAGRLELSVLTEGLEGRMDASSGCAHLRYRLSMGGEEQARTLTVSYTQ